MTEYNSISDCKEAFDTMNKRVILSIKIPYDNTVRASFTWEYIKNLAKEIEKLEDEK